MCKYPALWSSSSDVEEDVGGGGGGGGSCGKMDRNSGRGVDDRSDG